MDAFCIAKAGLMAGLVMGIIAMVLNMLKITSLDLTQYTGCMLTGQPSGLNSMAAGLGLHIAASIFFAFLYLWVARYLSMPLNETNGALFGLIHALIGGGLLLPIMDSMNGCVTSGKVKAMQMFAQGHGNAGILTYFAVHVVYGVALAIFL